MDFMRLLSISAFSITHLLVHLCECIEYKILSHTYKILSTALVQQ